MNYQESEGDPYVISGILYNINHMIIHCGIARTCAGGS